MIKLYIYCSVLIIGNVEVGPDIGMTFHREMMDIVSYDTKEGKIEVATIVWDGIVVNMVESTIEYILIVFICCYYVYDLAYPRKYCQFLGLMQHLVIEDPFLDTKSSGFLGFLHKISAQEKKKVNIEDSYKNVCMFMQVQYISTYT